MLIPEPAPGARLGCDCLLVGDTVQGLVLRRLGKVIDTTKGTVPWFSCKRAFSSVHVNDTSLVSPLRGTTVAVVSTRI